MRSIISSSNDSSILFNAYLADLQIRLPDEVIDSRNSIATINNKLTVFIRNIHGPQRKERNDVLCFWNKRRRKQ